MSLTKLNSQMIDMPLSVPTLSARSIQSPLITSANINVTNLSANNYYASNIFNNTDLFGDLTVHGSITSLSSFNVVSTLATTTSSLSVVNTGLGRAFNVTQYSNTEGIASFKGNNGEVVRVNNNNPDVGQAGVAIAWNNSGPALSAQGYSNFNTINANTINASNVITTNATVNNLNVDTITRLNSISATDIVTNNIILPPAGGSVINSTTFYGDINVLGRITSLSAIEIVSTSTTTTSALSVINAGSVPAIYVKQQQSNTQGIANFVGSNDVSVLRVNNTLPDIGQDAVRIIYTGTGNTFVAGNSANQGSTAFIITSAGSVGIGVVNPSTALHVNGNVTAGTFIGNLQGNASGVADGTVNALKLTTNAVLADKIVDNAVITSKINNQAVTTEKIALSAVTPAKLSIGSPVWDTSGNVGIGTSSPKTTLDVNGTIRSTYQVVPLSGSGVEVVYWNGTGYVASYDRTANNFLPLSLQGSTINLATSGTNRLYVDTGGDVIIGNAADTNTLRYLDVYNTNAGPNAGSIIRLITSNSTGSGNATVDMVKYKTGGFTINNNDSAGYVAINNAGAERFRIDASGNVGIGTPSPGATLDVHGSVGINAPTGGSGALLMPNSTGNPLLQLVTNQGQAQCTSIVNNWGAPSNPGVLVGTTQPNGTAFQVAASIPLTSGLPSGPGTNIITALASGNVGIGTSSPSAKLEVARTDSADGIRVTVGQGAYAGNVALFGVTGQSNGYQITKDSVNNIEHIWSGTGGAERLRITSNGTINANSNPITNCKTTAKAWVNFYGGNGGVRGSYNVSSVTRTAAGQYTINFSTAMADTNYSLAGMTGNSTGGGYVRFPDSGTVLNTGSVLVQTLNNNGSAITDFNFVTVIIFGN